MRQLFKHIDDKQGEIIHLLQKMIQIPSPTYQEGDLAAFLDEQLRSIGLETFTNPLGDVTGIYRGSSADNSLFMLNTHLDQAEAGDMEDAFSGRVMDGSEFGVAGKVIYGRGANGQKACLAAMVAAAKAVIDAGIDLPKGFVINAGVMEECGGHLSPEYLLNKDKLPIFAVLCGEHTDLKPVNGQRGMLHIYLKIEGKGSHAAAPEGSSSALTGMARVILALEEMNRELPKDAVYGDALVSLNKLFVMPNVINAIPDICEGVIDVRHPASLPREEIVPVVQKRVAEVVAQQDGLNHSAEIRKQAVKSYTGMEGLSDGGMYPCYTPLSDPLVAALSESIQEITGEKPEPEMWSISSEAGYFSTVAGLPVVAFGPGEDRFTHNRFEHVRVEDVMITTKVYAAMILKQCS
jgi:succinyl-diaminopimelate desuccinylase